MSEVQWHALQSLCTELSEFGAIKRRLEQRSVLNKTLAQWTAKQQSSVLMRQLQSLGITAATLSNGIDLLEDEQHKARGYMQWLDRAFVGNQPHPSLPFRNGPDASPLRHPAPTLGQHNNEVLGGILGLSDAELKKLAQEGVIGDKPKLPNLTP
jgi:crotonobetainyl-CoA:carnitine CoA-transferase CaiB-like acyl-CoA transferase